MGSQGVNNIKGGELWQRFKSFKDVRDSLVHPRRDREIDIKAHDVKVHIETTQELIQMISEHIWRKRLDF